MSEAKRRATETGGLEERIGYRFRDPTLLAAALAHSSALPTGVVRGSEQLEFLGDAVIDLAIADLLLRALPDLDEGRLSKRRAALVRTTTLADKARSLGLGDALVLGRGEERSGGREKDSLLAAVYESVLGAIYRDGGFQRARAVVARHFRARARRRRGDGAARLEDGPAGAHPGNFSDTPRIPPGGVRRPGARAPLHHRSVDRRRVRRARDSVEQTRGRATRRPRGSRAGGGGLSLVLVKLYC